MTKAEYDKKMAVLRKARSKASDARYEADMACIESDRVRREACKACDEADQAVDDLIESWATCA